MNKNISQIAIAKKQPKEVTDKLRSWMNQNNIFAGINIDEDTKRFYPYEKLASHIIGFCGSDNQGLDGLEAKYEETLRGQDGYIDRAQNAKGEDVGMDGEEHIDAIPGDDIVLTIDKNIQEIVERIIEETCIENMCTDGASIILMNPKNGNIWAMANYPNYNLNEPYILDNSEGLSQEEKTKLLQASWRNKAISDTYEPGSCFTICFFNSGSNLLLR